tara:strand:- start:2117 stop:4501 length:2385 start_codon:yes stop_codon:yes gene_type:complete
MGGIIEFIEDVVDTVIDVVVDIVEGVVDFVTDAVDFITDPFGSLMPDMPTGSPGGAANNQAQGVKLTKRGSSQPIPVVYGFRRVGGSIVYAETNGTDNKTLYVVYAFCEGEIEGFKNILIDGDQAHVFADKSTHAETVTIGTGKYHTGSDSLVRFQLFHGTEDQTQSSLANNAATWSNKQRKLPGMAYGVFEFTWYEKQSNDDPFQSPWSGSIPSIQIDVLGKKVFDCTTITTGATALPSAYSSLTKTYESGVGNNPINCLLDYMLNPRFGAGMDINNINAETFRIAANKLNQTVTYTEDGTQGPAMTINGVINTNNQLFDNIKQLLQGARSMMPFVQGRYKVKVEDAGNDTDITSSTVQIAQDLDDDNIIGGIQMASEKKSTKYNKVVVNFVHPDLEFTNQQVIKDQTSDFATADNNETLLGEFNFPTLTNEALARDLARIIVLKSRTARTIKLTATQESMNLEPGDIIRITQTVPNLNAKTFRITGLEINNNMTVTIQAVEHDAELYPFVSQPQVEIPPALFLPSQYVFTPTPKVNTPTPITVAPPNSSNTINNTLPTQPINTKPLYTVTTFGQTISGNNTNFHGNLTTSSILGIASDATVVSSFQTYPIIVGDKTNYTIKFAFATPQGTVTQLQAELIDRDSGATYKKQTYDIRTTRGSEVGLGFMNITEGTRVYIKFRFLDTAGNEYVDGSTGPFGADETGAGIQAPVKVFGLNESSDTATRAAGFAYTDLNGVARQGFTIEAEVNRLLQQFASTGAKSIQETISRGGVTSGLGAGVTAGSSTVSGSLLG